MSNKYFEAIESPYLKDSYFINYKDNFYNFIHFTDGSYRVYEARIFGLSFADYLRMARDIYGATIQGKGHTYPMLYFNKKEEADKLAKDLEVRFKYLINNLS